MRLTSFEVHRIECPLGRLIGDNSCAYDSMVILAVGLLTHDGALGWGYSQVMTSGQFERPAWWVRPLSSEAELLAIFQREWWPKLIGMDPDDLHTIRQKHRSSELGLDRAVRLALWDLMSQKAGVPLYVYLGANPAARHRKAYGSPVDYPLSDDQAVEVVQRMLVRGLNHIKIKIGAPSVARDIHRLKLVQSLAPGEIILAADANEAWTWHTTLDRLDDIGAAGIELEYIEDPLARDDVVGLTELAKRTKVRVIGHDYVSNIADMRRLVDAGLGGIRTDKDFDYMIECIDLARDHKLPVYIGNSQFEVSVHAAVAFPEVDCIEFSDLKWNELVQCPVDFSGGVATAPVVPGHGVKLRPEFLNRGIEVP